MRHTPGLTAEPAGVAAAPIELLDLEPPIDNVRREVIEGLSQRSKSLPCKFLYDERGSQLFDKICALPEYYPTRTELRIMRDHAPAIAGAVGPRALLVEYGSGSSLKTRLLLDNLQDAAAYVPIDISRRHLLHAARALAGSYPELPVRPVCADYTRSFHLPKISGAIASRTVAYFPGSTIGNFEPDQALAFLKSVRATCGRSSGLLIGVDLKKDPAVLHAAYNDAQGVTAAFNLNMLDRLNRDLGSDFQTDSFAHYALFNPQIGRIEMHLVSRQAQTVRIDPATAVRFEEGESIHTESSYKYTLDAFNSLASDAGYRRVAAWTDAQDWFSVQYFVGNG